MRAKRRGFYEIPLFKVHTRCAEENSDRSRFGAALPERHVSMSVLLFREVFKQEVQRNKRDQLSLTPLTPPSWKQLLRLEAIVSWARLQYWFSSQGIVPASKPPHESSRECYPPYTEMCAASDVRQQSSPRNRRRICQVHDSSS